METGAKKPDPASRASEPKGALAEWLHSPTRLRGAATAAVLLVGYMTVYGPLSGRIAQSTSRVKAAQKRLALARDIEQLRTEYDQFKDRIPKKTDSNEWVQYVLDGIRKLPLKLNTLDATGTKELGPYTVVLINVELEGRYIDLDSLLRWLETNERLFRVDELKVAPHRSGNGNLVMNVTVLGVMG